MREYGFWDATTNDCGQISFYWKLGEFLSVSVAAVVHTYRKFVDFQVVFIT